MAITQTELSPQLARLFYVAGLLDQNEWEVFRAGQQKHKPIMDVLTQQVSLGTIRDLFNAEISFKSRRLSQSSETGLHEGLTATGMINDEELKHLLTSHRPAIQALIKPLAARGYLNEDAIQRMMEKAESPDPSTYEQLLGEELISAHMVCQCLSHLEAAQMRLAALFLALSILKHNRLLGESDFLHLLAMLEPERIAEIQKYVQDQLGLGSRQIIEKLAGELALPQVQLGELEINPAFIKKFPPSMLRRQMMMPFNLNGHGFGIATSDPLNIPLTALLYWLTGQWLQPHFVPGVAILDKLNTVYGKPGPARGQAAPLAPPAPATAAPVAKAPAAKPPEERPAAHPGRQTEIVLDNVSAVQLVSTLIESAIELHTTAIHIEPSKNGLVVRFRIDGELHRIMTVPESMAQSVVSRVKVLADMDVTERRRPQDGHFELRMDRNNFDFRISTLPAIMGEKIVIRILDETRVQKGLESLGLLPKQQQMLKSMIDQPYGMVLVTGPTGSGKTSTLYAAMNLLNKENRNLVTIEDPVEYQLEGINQVQVDPHIGVTFAEGLRSILRQDPDIIMVGEIRDSDTAHIAIRAAMTGHLVFSTLHTNSALGAIDALVHLGSVPFMVAGSLIGILSQRLVRQLCPACRKPMKTTPAINRQLGLAEDLRKRIYKPVGCDECLGSGYMGRTGVFEVIHLNEQLRPKITTRKLDELEQAVRELEMMSLAEAGVQKVLDGATSVDEVAKKIMLDV
jgi:type IV pilus assembly protein PilB